MTRTTVLGGYQSDFARNLKREGLTLADLFNEVIVNTLAAAGVEPEQVESVHVGNAFGQLYTGQGHLGAMPATLLPELWGRPAMRHEAACASGSIATLSAMAEIEAGRYDVALVLGVEQEKTLPGAEAARVQQAAAFVGMETAGADPIWPAMFESIAAEYDRRYGIDDTHLRAIGALNLGNAKRNPNAQTRDWRITEASCGVDDAANPPVAGRLRRNDCCQITDGGAGIVLVSERWLKGNPRQRERAVISGWGHTTVGLPLAPKLARSRGARFVMPHVHGAITDAWRRAGIQGPDELDLIETHDCMTPSEYMAIDHFEITPPGQSWRAIEEGVITPGGRLPVNPSGGLIGGGHPVGATGVRMLLDVCAQVRGEAGAMQVNDARRGATLNIGGSTATTVSFVVERI